jgi:hypothetical protein
LVLDVHYVYEVFIFGEEIILKLKHNSINVMDDTFRVLPYDMPR